MRLRNLFAIIICLTTLGYNCQAQVFLRLDEADTAESLKFYAGAKIQVKLADYPDIWQKKRIVSFLPEEETVIFDQDFARIDEILAVRIGNSTSKFIGGTMQTFGTAWLVYGGIIALTGGEVTTTDAMIGVGAAGGGYLIRQLGKYKTFEIGKNAYQLHLIDARVF